MGAGASISSQDVPDYVDKEAAMKLAGDKFDECKFNEESKFEPVVMDDVLTRKQFLGLANRGESKEESRQFPWEENVKQWTRDRVKLLKKVFNEVSSEMPANEKKERWCEVALRLGGGISPKECQKKYKEQKT
jgi:hypothetical protein